MEPQDKVNSAADQSAADAAADADRLDPTDPNRAAADAPDGDEESLRGDPVDTADDPQEVLIDTHLAADEADPAPDNTGSEN